MPNTSNTSATPFYQVFMEIDGQFFTSDYLSKRSAMRMYKSLVASYGDTMNIYYHKSKPVHAHYTDDHGDDELEAAETLATMSHSSPLSGLHIENYGRGFMIHPKLSHPSYGEKYFCGGWWNAKAHGWFFKQDQLDSLMAMGAIYTSAPSSSVQLVDDDYNSEEDADYTDADFSTMVFMKYGKGYLMKPHRTHPDYGSKYFHNGFWNARAKGWFFKREFKEFLSEHGATYLHSAQSNAR